MKKRFSEEQIIRIVQQGKTRPIPEVCREHGIAKGTFYAWKNKFGDMSVSDAQRLKLLETENSKLKKLVAEQALDIVALKDVVSRKW
jgi:putative transposase